MSKQPGRRQFLQLAAVGGLVYASGLPGWQAMAATTRAVGGKQEDFYFVQLSDCHWGFKGAARKGFGPNTLGPFVGDANVETPEFKAYLVNIEKAAGGPPA